MAVIAVVLILVCLVIPSSLTKSPGTADGPSVEPRKPPIVSTPLGPIKGHFRTSSQGNDYEAYEGVPYALPPVGPRRFKSPERLEPWPGTLVATKLPIDCFQHERKVLPKDDILGSEDCLYLNVYAPLRDKIANRKVPVLFFIHGGAFQYGFGGSRVDYIVDYDVVMVTINYRLGVLGFLSTEDQVVPGNMGLKDQTMALKWVSENIESFGGDPGKVTLIGLSAGGSSVHYHFLSPASRGLFQNGISMSGTAFDSWSLTKNPRVRALEMGELVGCPNYDVRLMVECLRSRPATSLVNEAPRFMPWHLTPYTPFGPVIENNSSDPFIDRSPVDIIRSGDIAPVPWIVGVASEEGLYPVSEFMNDEKALKDLDENWETIAPYLLDYNETIPEHEKANVAKKIREYYFGDRPINKDSIVDLIHMVGDRLFIYDAENAAILQAKYGSQPVWFYNFAHRLKVSYYQNALDAAGMPRVLTGHGDDFVLAFSSTHAPPPSDPQDLLMQKELLKMIVSIAYESIPNFGPKWNHVDPNKNDLNYLHIRGSNDYTLILGTHDLANRQFWNSLGFNENKASNHDVKN